MEKGKIFISYRQSDTQSEASRLKEDLVEVFGEENVFFDIETLEPGLNFADAIEKTLSQSKVVLVMIGPTWAEVKDEEGNLRLFKENDWVRREVAMALSMEGVRVVPVLIKKAILPSASQLPDNIKELAGKHWKEISISRWKYDVGVLIKSIEQVIPKINKTEPKPDPIRRPVPKPPKSWWAKNYLWVLGVFVAFLIIGLIPDDEPYYDDPIDSNREYVTDDFNQEASAQLSEDGPLNVQGNWVVYSNGQIVSSFVMNQYPEEIQFVEYDVNGSNVGTGTGSISGNTLYLDYYNSYYDSYGEFILKTSNGGRSWEGTLKVVGSNQELTAALKRN
ncbi:toll/interleukin-1 receptor domain-containing protein [Algoriphagus chordae]|uniref:TIR domain-containing protein n=1 Tax=Algoriphagus chordae TaxID=237019 RepID=A0A2W7R9D0_9BACT|nr:toll/interleukin-1 receptor domain-containing protein [Algoriphagus chordae]PZX55716.1 TIR domain-containing protein [Algoriphagus chordae]